MSALTPDLLAQVTEIAAQAAAQAIAQMLGSAASLTQEPTTFDGRPIIPMRATEPVTCGVATATGEPCTRPTAGGPCWQHTLEAIQAREAIAPVREAKREQAQAKRQAWLDERGTQVVRAIQAHDGVLVLLTKANGTVASRSRRDLAALGFRGITKSTPTGEVEDMLRTAGIAFVSQAALSVQG